MSDGNGTSYLALARECLTAGICVVPARADKHPTLDSWKDYQFNLPLPEEVDEWFHEHHPFGIGFICGQISGGLEVIDLDAKHDPTGTLNARAETAIREAWPGLWERLTIERTTSGGLHLYYRCSKPDGNLKLARQLNHEGKLMAVAETRGEGGFIVAAPTPGYVLLQGRLTEPPSLSDEERTALFAAARSLDRSPPKPPEEPRAVNTTARRDLPAGYISPGDDYDARGDFFSLLRKHGWTSANNDHYWVRPGKTIAQGHSATWDTVPELPLRFHVFSPNADPLLQDENYKPWRVFSLLEAGGIDKKAAAMLYELGYGTRTKPKTSPPDQSTQSSIDAANEELEAANARRQEAYNKRLIENSLLADTTKAEPAKTPEEIRAASLKTLREKCYAHEFNFAVVPAKPIPRFLIKGNQVSTPGNLTCISGQAKTAKSATIDAMIAATVCAANGNAQDCDCLGFSASPPNGMNLLHFDSEQVHFDHDQLIRRALRRAKAEICPPWLRSFCLTGFSIPDRRLLIRLMLEDMQAIGGTHSVLLDGAADCVVNVNDDDETNPFVTELQNLAIEFKCPIVSVIHENPGQVTAKMRGHLGSQMERKSESNLRLTKSDDVITLFSERMRHGLILEKDGPQFSWDTEAAMHLSRVRGLSSKDLAKRDKLADLLEATFHHAGRDRLRYGELIKAIAETAGVGASRAEVRYAEMKSHGLLAKDLVGFWSISGTKG